MFWADRIADAVTERFAEKIKKGEPLIIRDEKTASGRVHVGSMRGVAIHGVLSEVLTERGIKNTFFYEINDIDPMDDIPSYLDEKIYRPYFMQPLYTVPSPGPGASNYAEYFAEEFIGVIQESGFTPEFYRATELYALGKMNEVIRTALDRRDLIREIYKRVSGSDKNADWFPVSLARPVDGVFDVRITGWDGEMLSYKTKEGKEGMLSPFDGNVKFTWKVDWAAKFKVMQVDIEGAGKDHSTKGGSRDVSEVISREVFEHEPPLNIPYEFFLVGGKKMSSSKGRGSSSREIADLLPPHLFRLALIGREPKRAIDFEPDGDTIPVLFDEYDKLATKFFSGAEDDDTRLFRFIHAPNEREHIAERFLPRFSLVAFLVQMPHMNLEQEVMRIKGGDLTAEDKKEIHMRAAYAKRWLDLYASEDFKYTLQEHMPESVKLFSSEQKQALKQLLTYVENYEKLDGQELHTTLHTIKTETGIDAKAFFSALYQSFLGRDSGPKAGWFLSVLDRDFIITRLKEVI